MAVAEAEQVKIKVGPLMSTHLNTVCSSFCLAKACEVQCCAVHVRKSVLRIRLPPHILMKVGGTQQSSVARTKVHTQLLLWRPLTALLKAWSAASLLHMLAMEV